jgi:aminoglycoside 6-adenylyltransferase
MSDIQRLQTNILTACQELAVIQAVLLIGSRARTEPPPDAFADIDYLLFTPETADFIPMPELIRAASPLWLADFSYTGRGDPEWMVVYEGGHKVDFIFTTIQPGQTLQQNLASTPYKIVLPRGFQMLLDKTASKGQIALDFTDYNLLTYPTTADFQSANDSFLLEAARAAKFIQRGDTWRAKDDCDNGLKKRLLTMIEWQASAKYGLEHDTWYDGRYLAQWADPPVVAALPDTFAAYETADLHRALQATLTLYDQLAAETAERLNFPYPTAGQQAALNWLKTAGESNAKR